MPELMFHLLHGRGARQGGGGRVSRHGIHLLVLALLVALQAPAMTALAAGNAQKRVRVVPAHARSLRANPRPASRRPVTEYREAIPTPGTLGHDISYPQCEQTPISGQSFLVVGINHGRPFTVNDCLGGQYARASGGIEPSLYVNAAFDPGYTTKITPACQAVPAIRGGQDHQEAWQVGCSEAEYSIAQATAALGPNLPSMWWLDVETENSWADDPGPNRMAILGVIDHLHASGFSTGIYSVGGMWRTIVGNDWQLPDPGVSNWVAGADAGAPQASCGRPFSNSQASVVMVQYIEGDLDTDYVCPLPHPRLQMPTAGLPPVPAPPSAVSNPPVRVEVKQTFGALRPASLRQARTVTPGTTPAP